MINATVKLVLQRLAALGYDLGKAGIDGVKGDKTTAALKAFQEAVGVEATGTATGATLMALLKATPQAAKPPIPNIRPPADQLGSGSMDNRPRLRPGDPAFAMSPSQQLGQGFTNAMPNLRPNETPRLNVGQANTMGGPGSSFRPGNASLTPFPQGRDPSNPDSWVQADAPPGVDTNGMTFQGALQLDKTRGSQYDAAVQRWRAPVGQGGMGNAIGPGVPFNPPMQGGPPPPAQFTPPDGQYADRWLGKMGNSPNAPGFDPNQVTTYEDQFGDVSIPDSNNAPPGSFDLNKYRSLPGNFRQQGQPPQGPAPQAPPPQPPQVASAAPPPMAGLMPPPQQPPPQQGPAEGMFGGLAGALGGAFAPPPPGWQPSGDQPGYGLPGMPSNPSFLGAVGDAGRAAVGGIQNMIGGAMGQPANASSPSRDFTPPPQAGNPDLQNALQQAAAKQQLETMLWQMMLGSRIQQTPGPYVKSDLSAPAAPPPPPFASPSGAYR